MRAVLSCGIATSALKAELDSVSSAFDLRYTNFLGDVADEIEEAGGVECIIITEQSWGDMSFKEAASIIMDIDNGEYSIYILIGDEERTAVMRDEVFSRGYRCIPTHNEFTISLFLKCLGGKIKGEEGIEGIDSVGETERDNEKVDECTEDEVSVFEAEYEDELSSEYTEEDSGKLKLETISVGENVYEDTAESDNELESKEKDVEVKAEKIGKTKIKGKTMGKVGNIFKRKHSKRSKDVSNKDTRVRVVDKFKNNKVDSLECEVSRAVKTGGIIMVTGTSGSGVSTVVANLANVVASSQNTVTILDLDLVYGAHSKMTMDGYKAIEYESDGVIRAIKGTSYGWKGSKLNVDIIRPNYRVLGTGTGYSGTENIDEAIEKGGISRVLASLITYNQVVIIDVGLRDSIQKYSELWSIVENVVCVIDASKDKSIINTIVDIGSTDSDVILDNVFEASLIFNRANKYRGKVLGKRGARVGEIGGLMDKIVSDMEGGEATEFRNMPVIGGIAEMDNLGWFGNLHSDLSQYRKEYSELLIGILGSKG